MFGLEARGGPASGSRLAACPSTALATPSPRRPGRPDLITGPRTRKQRALVRATWPQYGHGQLRSRRALASCPSAPAAGLLRCELGRSVPASLSAAAKLRPDIPNLDSFCRVEQQEWPGGLKRRGYHNTCGKAARQVKAGQASGCWTCTSAAKSRRVADVCPSVATWCLSGKSASRCSLPPGSPSLVSPASSSVAATAESPQERQRLAGGGRPGCGMVPCQRSDSLLGQCRLQALGSGKGVAEPPVLVQANTNCASTMLRSYHPE